MKRGSIYFVYVLLALACSLCAISRAVGQGPVPSQSEKLLASASSILQSVVSITVETTIRLKNPAENEYGSFSASSHGLGFRVATKRGMGFFVSTNGFIMTTAHLVEGADKVTVTLYGNAVLIAEVIGSDHNSDVSILRIDRQDSSPLAQGDSAVVRAGEIAVSASNPFGLDASLKFGTVSSNAVSVRTARGQYDDIIQTDIVMEPESTGSPLLDSQARVIGMNVAMLRGTNQVVSEATLVMPVNRLNVIMRRLIKESEHLKTKGFQQGDGD